MNKPKTETNFTVEDIEKLSNLTRLSLTEDEKAQFAKEIGGILAYVGQIQEVSSQGDISKNHIDPKRYPHRNILREDIADKGTGEELNPDNKVLIESSPENSGDYIKVKKILGSSQ